MLEDKINNILDDVEHQLDLMKIKSKNAKKEYKQIDKKTKDNEYVDDEMVKCEKARLSKEIEELELETYKIKKVLYRLRVCLNILNNEEE